MLRSLARTAPRAMASALIALIAITAPEGAAAAGHFDLQRPIRVAVTIADPERIALSLPDGATATVGSRPLDLGNAASEIIIARSGWRISMPVRPPPVRGSNAVSRSEPSTFAYGSYASQAAAWRLRRLVHAEFGIMPPVERARTHMAVNGKNRPRCNGVCNGVGARCRRIPHRSGRELLSRPNRDQCGRVWSGDHQHAPIGAISLLSGRWRDAIELAYRGAESPGGCSSDLCCAEDRSGRAV